MESISENVESVRSAFLKCVTTALADYSVSKAASKRPSSAVATIDEKSIMVDPVTFRVTAKIIPHGTMANLEVFVGALSQRLRPWTVEVSDDNDDARRGTKTVCAIPVVGSFRSAVRSTADESAEIPKSDGPIAPKMISRTPKKRRCCCCFSFACIMALIITIIAIAVCVVGAATARAYLAESSFFSEYVTFPQFGH